MCCLLLRNPSQIFLAVGPHLFIAKAQGLSAHKKNILKAVIEML